MTEVKVVHEKGNHCHFCGQVVDGFGGELWVDEVRDGEKIRIYYPACEGCCDA